MAYLSNVSYGRVARTSVINKFGRNVTFDSGTDEDMWDKGGNWVAPTTARLHDITSNNEADDAGLTGALTVEIQGLDSDWNIVSETITMDGTGNVETVNSYLRIYRMIVKTAGSTGANVGTITATAQTDTTVTAQINPTNNQSLMAIYTVPVFHIALLHQYYFSVNAATLGQSGATQLNMRLLIKPGADEADKVFELKHIMGTVASGSTHLFHRFLPPLRVDEMSDIKLRISDIVAGITDGDVGAGFDIELRQNG